METKNKPTGTFDGFWREFFIPLFVVSVLVGGMFTFIGFIGHAAYESQVPTFSDAFELGDIVKLQNADMKEFLKVQKEIGYEWEIVKVETNFFFPTLYFLTLKGDGDTI